MLTCRGAWWPKSSFPTRLQPRHADYNSNAERSAVVLEHSGYSPATTLDCLQLKILSILSQYPCLSNEPRELSRAVSSTMPELDALISEYSHLKNLPREKEALHALQKIASLVKPIMRARSWTVGTLAEFYPDSHNLLGAQG
jgi:hypothetical protein